MARVFVIGATGGIGRLVCQKLMARDDEPVGLHRRPNQAAGLRHLGIESCLGDLGTVSPRELATMMRGCTAVVFAAGASEEGLVVAEQVDREGVCKALRASENAGVVRFLHVSAFPDAHRGKQMSEAFEHYMQIKRQADVEVASSALDWMIVRPGTLTNVKEEPSVRLGLAIPYGRVSRTAVASVLVELVHSPLRRMIIEMTDGPLTVTESLAGLL